MNSIFLIGMPGTGEWVIVLVSLLLPAFAVMDILRNQFKGGFDNKLIWILLVIFLPIFGSILYFVFGRDQRATR